MVDAMSRSMESWAQEPYGSRQAPYPPTEHQSPGLRLPPPSSLVAGPASNTDVPSGRETAYRQPSFSSTYGGGPSPVHQMSPQTPITAGDPYGVASNTSSLHPSLQSSPTSARPEDVTESKVPRPQAQPLKSAAPSPAYPELVRPPMAYPTPDPTPTTVPGQRQEPQEDGKKPERVRISDIISGGSGGGAQAEATQPAQGSKAPALSAPAAAASPSSKSRYVIKVRQQPVAARSCGFGERDRRVIDPPPIVQVFIEDPTASEAEIRERLQYPTAVMHCTIWNEAGDQDCSTMPDEFRQQRRLMGTVVSTPFFGLDEKDEEGCFFTFPDLSCRTPGSFRLRFALVILHSVSGPGSRTPVCAVAMSEPFTVYNAKDFPGMQASTSLTKRLKEQGCLISIKKGNERNGGANTRDDSDEEGDDDELGPPSAKRRRP